MQIDLIELRLITERLLSHIIETRNVKNFEIEETYYWNIPWSTVRDVSKDPQGFDIGNLADDWEFLKSLLQKDAQPVAYQLTELAPLLRCIGEVLGTQLAKKGG